MTSSVLEVVLGAAAPSWARPAPPTPPEEQQLECTRPDDGDVKPRIAMPYLVAPQARQAHPDFAQHVAQHVAAVVAVHNS